MTVNWAQILFNSVLTGSIYLLGAVGLTMTYGLSGFPNFAHAEFITLGAFIGYFVADQLGLGLPLAFIVAFLVSGIVAFLCYRGIFQPLAKRGATTIHLMVASIALGFILRHSIGAIWSWRPLYFTTSWPAFDLGPIRVTGLWLLLIFTAVTLAFVMHLILTRTKIGKAIRATSSNPELALASGINIDRVIWITWFVGGGLAAVAGIFRGADTQIWPMTGWDIILPMFAVVILGGIGNFYGAIAAAFIVGLAENIGVVALIALGLSTTYRMAIPFVILIITLIIKPQGLAMLFRRA
ncbi:MAG: branched-chain amino acid ABC transporter permease [Dehalococcoidales bacterium]|jgi:branched-subunit amino acid ABC-type transport system permease component|nr:branched-chain amino acid ABC transporter permease [Dehalococcoidales bacterium]RLC60348.1 MAG: branched-chain amino acid ABC transporter permease [Chloroflexota bacterium]